jgi:hypothetical protein
VVGDLRDVVGLIRQGMGINGRLRENAA